MLAVVVEMAHQELRSRKRGVEKEEEADGREVVLVKEGSVVRGGRRRRMWWKAKGLLIYCDWQVVTDLKPQIVFPEEICVTRLCPDIVIWSATRQSHLGGVVMTLGREH